MQATHTVHSAQCLCKCEASMQDEEHVFCACRPHTPASPRTHDCSTRLFPLRVTQAHRPIHPHTHRYTHICARIHRDAAMEHMWDTDMRDCRLSQCMWQYGYTLHHHTASHTPSTALCVRCTMFVRNPEPSHCITFTVYEGIHTLYHDCMPHCASLTAHGDVSLPMCSLCIQRERPRNTKV